MNAKHTAIVVVVLAASLTLALVAILRRSGWRGLLPNGDIGGFPEDDDPEEPVPDVSPAEARLAMDAVLADRDETWRRLSAIADRLPELRALAAKHRRRAAK